MPQGITVVGLGPGAPELLTVQVQQLLASAGEIYVRTQRHPTVNMLTAHANVHSFDEVYERADSFEQVYSQIAEQIVRLGSRPEGVIYAVPGHPLFGEASVQRILSLAAEKGLEVRVLEGLSFVDAMCTRLQLDPLSGLQIADATELAMRHYPAHNPDLSLLIGQLYSREIAADIKLILMTVYPDDHKVTLVTAAGTKDETLVTIPLYELDRGTDISHLTSLYVPPLAIEGSLPAFQELVAHLRAPEGCPWDREQTHRSLRPFLLEEAYEVLEALDSEDSEALKEELGDLLLQILLHTQIALEEGEFRMADVVAHILAKLRRRHPHVFGEVHVANAQEVLVNWQKIKNEEKSGLDSAKATCGTGGGTLGGVPTTLPALARAQGLGLRAARVGFDWPNDEGAWAKAEEEWQELRSATTRDEQEKELGDLLFSLTVLASRLDLDAESALRGAIARFGHRFGLLEHECAARGKQMTDLKASDLLELWSQTGRQNG